MEERGNKTIMCSVLFLDIVEYSRKSVAGQISLKDRFNSYLSNAIYEVPTEDRIILDTGDGAAINFLGCIEDALKAALSLRESMLNEDPHMDPPLMVRMGINLGPVRLVRDINGQPNIVGDGINVAQRIVGFADASQILVSRSYFDAVSHISPAYAKMFHYQGSRTDKHVREHEIYAIGYPGDKTAQLASVNAAAAGAANQSGQTGMKRALYAGAIAIPLIVLGVWLFKPSHSNKAPAAQNISQTQAESGIRPVPVASAVPQPESRVASGVQPPVRPDTKKIAEAKPAEKNGAEVKTDSKKVVSTVKPPVAPQKAKVAESAAKAVAPVDKTPVAHPKEAYISIACKKAAQIFVDGTLKGRLGEKAIKVELPPGKHVVIVSSTSGLLHKQDVNLDPGETEQVKPEFCN